MDRADIARRLAQAQDAVARADKHLKRQKASIDRLERGRGDPADVADARRYLLAFEDNLKRHIEDRDRIEEELAEYDAGVRRGGRHA
jgi:hypothetical protein